jgi:hypothetical protein
MDVDIGTKHRPLHLYGNDHKLEATHEETVGLIAVFSICAMVSWVHI